MWCVCVVGLCWLTGLLLRCVVLYCEGRRAYAGRINRLTVVFAEMVI